MALVVPACTGREGARKICDAVEFEGAVDLLVTGGEVEELVVVVESHNLLLAPRYELSFHPLGASPYAPEFYASVLRMWLQPMSETATAALTRVRALYTAYMPLRQSCSQLGAFLSRPFAVARCHAALASLQPLTAALPLADELIARLCGVVADGHLALIALIVLNVAAFFPASASWGGEWALSRDNASLLRLTSYQFAHAGWLHLAGNMLSLLAVGGELSTALDCDPLLFVLLYLACGYAGGLACVTLQGALTRTVGASGAVSGVIIALTVLRPHSAVSLFGVTASSPLAFLAGSLGADFVRDLQSRAAGRGGISYVCHLGGGLCGYALASAFKGVHR